MRGIILAGGNGKRLAPLTKVTNKHLLPVGQKPMILHPLGKLVEAKMKDIMVITGREHMGDVMSLLGSGSEYGCRLTYRVQDEAGGIAEALGLCEDFAMGHRVMVILGDNIFMDNLACHAEHFQNSEKGAMVLVVKSPTPGRFGVVEFDELGNVVGVEEKPKAPKSNWVQTGVYFYDHRVFNAVKGLKRSERGELEITDVTNYYLQMGQLEVRKLDGKWTDAGTFPSYAEANRMMDVETKNG